MPETLDPALAAEYRRRPYGLHSPALQALLDRMRQPGFDRNEWLVVTIEPFQRYQLYRRFPDRPPEPASNHVYGSLEDCEWAVFGMRWEQLTGAAPEVP